MPIALKSRLGFAFAELGLVTGKPEISRKISAVLSAPVALKRFYPGRGWGLKYLVYLPGADQPSHVLKAATRIIERRLERSLGGAYVDYCRRFELEAAVLNALAAENLGPRVNLRADSFFLRDYLPGKSFQDFPPEKLPELLPAVLAALDRMCDADILHSDPNAGNVILEPGSGLVSFIDSEIPVRRTPPVRVEPAERAGCHERLLMTLGRTLREKDRLSESLAGKLAEVAENYYGAVRESLPRHRTAALLAGVPALREEEK